MISQIGGRRGVGQRERERVRDSLFRLRMRRFCFRRVSFRPLSFTGFWTRRSRAHTNVSQPRRNKNIFPGPFPSLQISSLPSGIPVGVPQFLSPFYWVSPGTTWVPWTGGGPLRLQCHETPCTAFPGKVMVNRDGGSIPSHPYSQEWWVRKIRLRGLRGGGSGFRVDVPTSKVLVQSGHSGEEGVVWIGKGTDQWGKCYGGKRYGKSCRTVKGERGEVGKSGGQEGSPGRSWKVPRGVCRTWGVWSVQ